MNQCLSQLKNELDSKKVESDVFFLKPKHQNRLSQQVEWIYRAQWLNEWRLLCEFVFIPIEKWTLILKMAEREVFLMKPRHQYHLSQWGECIYGA